MKDWKPLPQMFAWLNKTTGAHIEQHDSKFILSFPHTNSRTREYATILDAALAGEKGSDALDKEDKITSPSPSSIPRG
jgi:hypothetical protein